MRRRFMLALAIAGMGALSSSIDQSRAEDADLNHPLSEARRHELAATFAKGIAEAEAAIQRDSRSVAGYSRRGDQLFFAGKFADAVTDFDRMVELDSTLESSHWRRGIAYFYAGSYKSAARQFEIYHTFDDVDRENGIWRYLSQVKALGRDKAREGLLKYKKDDREPFPAVYQLFAGKTTPDAILKDIRDAKIDDAEREKRLFYAQLYIGLNHAVEDEPEKARTHLREAVANKWGPTAGGGPTWMWHVGRVHYELLAAKKDERKAAP